MSFMIEAHFANVFAYWSFCLAEVVLKCADFFIFSDFSQLKVEATLLRTENVAYSSLRAIFHLHTFMVKFCVKHFIVLGTLV